MKGWYGNRQAHSLASKGIKTKNTKNINYIKLVSIVEKFRKEQEDFYDWEYEKDCFKGTCHYITKQLVIFLKNNGFNNVKRVGGYYTDVSNNFEPNMNEWDFDDIEDFNEKFDNKWKHWWVEVDNKWIVDITAEQFHPETPEDYRIIITDIGDLNYE